MLTTWRIELAGRRHARTHARALPSAMSVATRIVRHIGYSTNTVLTDISHQRWSKTSSLVDARSKCVNCEERKIRIHFWSSYVLSRTWKKSSKPP